MRTVILTLGIIYWILIGAHWGAEIDITFFGKLLLLAFFLWCVCLDTYEIVNKEKS